MHTPPIAHYSVLYREVLELLAPAPGHQILDGTVGGAGHSRALLSRIGSEGHLWGIERDTDSYQRAQALLAEVGHPFTLIHGNFADLPALAETFQIPPLDGILLDLGTSMFQLRQPERGFSFMAEARLDMRMDPYEAIESAYDLVNFWSEAQLADIFFRYGEERAARRIARRIVEQRRQRPITTTTELAEVVTQVVPRTGKIHPATKIFQALRMAVNREMEALELVLPAALNQLRSGGRLAVIAFHSLEDRQVKQFFRAAATDCVCPPRQPICTCDHRAIGRLVRTKATQPSEQELAENPSSRSARLRVFEKK